jgi:hypothetical protein
MKIWVMATFDDLLFNVSTSVVESVCVASEPAGGVYFTLPATKYSLSAERAFVPPRLIGVNVRAEGEPPTATVLVLVATSVPAGAATVTWNVVASLMVGSVSLNGASV